MRSAMNIRCPSSGRYLKVETPCPASFRVATRRCRYTTHSSSSSFKKSEVGSSERSSTRCHHRRKWTSWTDDISTALGMGAKGCVLSSPRLAVSRPSRRTASGATRCRSSCLTARWRLSASAKVFESPRRLDSFLIDRKPIGDLPRECCQPWLSVASRHSGHCLVREKRNKLCRAACRAVGLLKR